MVHNGERPLNNIDVPDGNRVKTSGIQSYTYKLSIFRLRITGTIIVLTGFTILIIIGLAQTGH